MSRFPAQFVASASTLEQCPRWRRAEVAIAGRSNVGKSSLLNALAEMKAIARTSKTPGRTRSLNFFAAGDNLALTDLPGYGYAKVPHDLAQKIAAMMRDYLTRRRNLVAIMILVDARREPGDEERELVAMARERRLEIIAAATKCDKLRRSERMQTLARLESLDLQPVLCSARSGEGIEELRRRLLKLAAAEDRPRAVAR